MRLLTTIEPWKFVETYEAQPYAILSHTWITTHSGKSQEVSYQEFLAYMEDPEKNTNITIKPGFEKLKNAIDYAADEGHEFIWIDTCCIDKTNQLELDEAIRCMFKWYQDATICYAYLSDVHILPQLDVHEQVRLSRWFTRGWTLQELVAPSDVIFLAEDWSYLGHRLSEGSFGEVLRQASGISEAVLYGTFETSEISISERMRWAARRKTTRIEDMAYSLMGIFGVHMPIMYGEGKDAFIRLQKEILRNSDDPSIFVWTSPLQDSNQISGLLADSPECFADAKNFQQSYGFEASPDEWEDTNRGIRLQLPIYPCGEDQGNTDYFVHLDCFYIDYEGDKMPMLRLRHLGGDEFARVHATRIFWRTSKDPKTSAERKSLFVKQTPLYRQPELIVAREHLYLQKNNNIFGFRLLDVYPRAYWNGNRFHNAKGLSSKPQPAAIFRFARLGSSSYIVDVAVGFQNEGSGIWRPWHMQRRCKKESEHIGRVHKLVCRKMASGTIGPHHQSDDGDGFSQDIHSTVTITAPQRPAQFSSYTIRIESPADIVSLLSKSIKPQRSTIDYHNSVPDTISFEIYKDVLQNITEFFTPSVAYWPSLGETMSDDELMRVVRLGPRDYSSMRKVWWETPVTSYVIEDLNESLSYGMERVRHLLSELMIERKQWPSQSQKLSSGSNNFTPLHRAAVDGDMEAVTSIIQAGAYNIFDTADGWSACHMAAALGHGSVVQILLNSFPSLAVLKNKDPGLKDGPCSLNRYESIFHIVAGLPNIPKGNFLSTPSFWALYVERTGTSEARNFIGETALHCAAASGNLDVVILLLRLDRGDVGAVDVNNRTPLWHAAAAGHGEIVDCLLVGKPRTRDLYREDFSGYSELHIACWCNHARVVYSLLSHTTEPNVPSSKFEFTPAHLAYHRDSIACIEILEYFNADMEVRSTPSWIGTSPKGMKAFYENVLSRMPSHDHLNRLHTVALS